MHLLESLKPANTGIKKASCAIVFGLFIAANLMCLAPRARAQAQGVAKSNQALPSARRVVDLLAEKLNLSDTQKAQMLPIITERQQNLRKLRNASMRRFRKARKMKDIFKDSDKRIKAILTGRQWEEYVQIEKEMRKQMKERMQNRASSN